MLFFKEKIFFSCNFCGSCCKEMDIPITHYDIERIIKSGTTLELDMFITFYPSTPESEYSALLYNEYSTLFLSNNLSDNACIFLVDNKCSIYEHRPNTCRTWPISKNENNRLQIDEIAQVLVNSACDKKRFKDHKEISKNIDIGLFELENYKTFLKFWNAKVKDKIELQTIENFVEDFKDFL